MVQPTQSDPQFKLRLPRPLKERLEQAAEINNRSMNAQIVAILEAALPPVSGIVQLGRAISELSEQVSATSDTSERRRLEASIQLRCSELQKLIEASKSGTNAVLDQLQWEAEETAEEHVRIRLE